MRGLLAVGMERRVRLTQRRRSEGRSAFAEVLNYSPQNRPVSNRNVLLLGIYLRPLSIGLRVPRPSGMVP